MRGSDGGPWRRLPALPAFWVGILYDDVSLDAAWDSVKDWSAQERQKLRDDVPRQGFAATVRGRSMLELARECLALAQQGCSGASGSTKTGATRRAILRRCEEFVARGITPAQELLEKYHGAWGRVGRAGVRRIRLLEFHGRGRRWPKGTPATVALTKAGVAFKLHEYDYDPNAARIGLQAAEALGVFRRDC